MALFVVVVLIVAAGIAGYFYSRSARGKAEVASVEAAVKAEVAKIEADLKKL